MNNEKPAFTELAENNGILMVWANRTLLPDIADTLGKSHHPDLRDLSRACVEVFRREKTKCSNDNCEIVADNDDLGARIAFKPAIGHDAIRSFINTPNRAVAKIGFEWRNLIGWEEKSEIRWRGRRDFFLCGVNIPAQAATLTLNRSAITELARILPLDHPFREVFFQLTEILDEENYEVNEDLDEETAAVDESLLDLQGH